MEKSNCDIIYTKGILFSIRMNEQLMQAPKWTNPPLKHDVCVKKALHKEYILRNSFIQTFRIDKTYIC